ncbi:MAG: hypothetical protein H6825_14635 [Planctomycetes bacterium]|nr:hypothetical protein [Planctomycetota bacterium]
MFLTLALPLVLAAPMFFDKVLLKDGRLVEGKLIESTDPDYCMLRLPGADIPIRNDLVQLTYVEDMEDYVPKDKKEADYLKKGWVLFEGRWMSRTRREQELGKRAEEDKAAIAKLREEQKWKNAKSTETLHFEVKSNCTQEVMDDYANRLENYYKYFLDEWNITVAPSEKKKKQKFFLYRNYDDFLEVTGSRYGVGGFFNWVKGELQLYHDDKKYDFTVAILYHEGNHLLTHLIDPQFIYPTWMNEGTAEYFGTAKVGPKGEFVVGGLQYERIVSLRNDAAHGKEIPLRELLLAPQGSLTARHYAVAWSFVHFLMSTDYAKKYRLFFANLPENRDVKCENGSSGAIVVRIPELPTVIAAFEKAMGKSLDELTVEWKDFCAQAYGELNADAYYKAVQFTLFTGGDLTEDAVKTAKEYYEKAIALGITDSECYRDYAEFLRKGGIDDRGETVLPYEPDVVGGWDMIQKAIDLDPIDPLNYCEAAGQLIMDSPIQDIDKAEALVKTARALDSRSWQVQALTNELMSMIEPAKERRRDREERERMLAENDNRVWIVQPFHYANEPEPEQITDLSTDDLMALIEAGEVDELDYVFQTWRPPNPETGELEEGTEPWDTAWTQLKDVPVFTEALAAAKAAAGG